MNEEEIIKNIKEMIQWSDYNTYKIALQGILDLYEQEKARNKDLEQIEKEHKEENGRLREELGKIKYIKRSFDYCLEQKTKELEKEIKYWREQAEGYQGLAEQIKEDFENRDRWE